MQFKNSLGVTCTIYVHYGSYLGNGLGQHFFFGKISSVCHFENCLMPPTALKNISVVDFARILAIEVSIHCALDARGEWIAIFSSFNCKCKQMTITSLHKFLHNVSPKLSLEKLMSLLMLAKCLHC
jgi:hypothetical protein